MVAVGCLIENRGVSPGFRSGNRLEILVVWTMVELEALCLVQSTYGRPVSADEVGKVH
jgi:hypothetical protein